MLLLFETPAGYAIFKVLDEGKLQQAEVRGNPGWLTVKFEMGSVN